MNEATQQLDLWTTVYQKCATCEEEKILEDFGSTKLGKPMKACKACRTGYQTKHQKNLRLESEQWLEKQSENEEPPKREYELRKVCVACGKEKVAAAFRWIYVSHKVSNERRKRAEKCEECENIISLQKADFKRELAERERTEASLALDWAERIKAKHRKNYDQHLKARFGKTVEEYDAMVQAQEGKCAICKKNPTTFNERLFVDHSHVTGSVRGLLCQSCNFGLGCFYDNRESLQHASEYLRHWNEWEE